MAKRCSKISEGCFVIKYKINLRLVLSPLIKTTLVSCNENSRKIGSVVVARPGLMTQRIARSFSLSLSWLFLSKMAIYLHQKENAFSE